MLNILFFFSDSMILVRWVIFLEITFFLILTSFHTEVSFYFHQTVYSVPLPHFFLCFLPPFDMPYYICLFPSKFVFILLVSTCFILLVCSLYFLIFFIFFPSQFTCCTQPLTISTYIFLFLWEVSREDHTRGASELSVLIFSRICWKPTTWCWSMHCKIFTWKWRIRGDMLWR